MRRPNLSCFSLTYRDLWREDGKLGQTVANARENLQSNERALQGMMDKESSYPALESALISRTLPADCEQSEDTPSS